MTTKLHIDISQGVVSIEGDPGLVREIYSDFKNGLLNQVNQPIKTQENQADESPASQSKPTTRKQASRKKHSQAGPRGGDNDINPSKPKVDPSLDINIQDWEKFYNQFKIQNISEAILISTEYLIEKVKVSEPNLNQIYTCLYYVERTSKNFAQAFKEAKKPRVGYITYKSLKASISITPKGRDHLDRRIKRKASSK